MAKVWQRVFASLLLGAHLWQCTADAATPIHPDEILCHFQQHANLPTSLPDPSRFHVAASSLSPTDPQLPKNAFLQVESTIQLAQGNTFSFTFVQWKRRRPWWTRWAFLRDQLVVRRYFESKLGRSSQPLATVNFDQRTAHTVSKYPEFLEAWQNHGESERKAHKEGHVFQQVYELRGEALVSFLANFDLSPSTSRKASPSISVPSNTDASRFRNWIVRVAHVSFRHDQTVFSGDSRKQAVRGGLPVLATRLEHLRWEMDVLVGQRPFLPRKYTYVSSNEFQVVEDQQQALLDSLTLEPPLNSVSKPLEKGQRFAAALVLLVDSKNSGTLSETTVKKLRQQMRAYSDNVYDYSVLVLYTLIRGRLDIFEALFIPLMESVRDPSEPVTHTVGIRTIHPTVKQELTSFFWDVDWQTEFLNDPDYVHTHVESKFWVVISVAMLAWNPSAMDDFAFPPKVQSVLEAWSTHPAVVNLAIAAFWERVDPDAQKDAGYAEYLRNYFEELFRRTLDSRTRFTPSEELPIEEWDGELYDALESAIEGFMDLTDATLAVPAVNALRELFHDSKYAPLASECWEHKVKSALHSWALSQTFREETFKDGVLYIDVGILPLLAPREFLAQEFLRLSVLVYESLVAHGFKSPSQVVSLISALGIKLSVSREESNDFYKRGFLDEGASMAKRLLSMYSLLRGGVGLYQPIVHEYLSRFLDQDLLLDMHSVKAIASEFALVRHAYLDLLGVQIREENFDGIRMLARYHEVMMGPDEHMFLRRNFAHLCTHTDFHQDRWEEHAGVLLQGFPFIQEQLMVELPVLMKAGLHERVAYLATFPESDPLEHHSDFIHLLSAHALALVQSVQLGGRGTKEESMEFLRLFQNYPRLNAFEVLKQLMMAHQDLTVVRIVQHVDDRSKQTMTAQLEETSSLLGPIAKENRLLRIFLQHWTAEQLPVRAWLQHTLEGSSRDVKEKLEVLAQFPEVVSRKDVLLVLQELQALQPDRDWQEQERTVKEVFPLISLEEPLLE